MNLQVFDMDNINTYDFEVDKNGKPTGKIISCDNPYCSQGHVFSLYKEGVWQGYDLNEVYYGKDGKPYVIPKG